MGNLSSRAANPTSTTLIVAADPRDVSLCLTLSAMSRGCRVVLAAGDSLGEYRAALLASSPVRRGLGAKAAERALHSLLERLQGGLVRVRPHSRAELLAELSTNLSALLPAGLTPSRALDNAAFVNHTLLAESEALSHYPGTQLLVFASAARTNADRFRFMRQVLRDCLVRCRPVAKVIVPNCGGALIEPVFPGSLMGAVRCALETIYRECQGRGAPVPAFSLHYYLFGLGCDAHAPPITAALNLLNFHDRYPRSRGRFDDNLAEHFYQRYLATSVAPGPALAGWTAAYELLCKNSCEDSWWWVYFNVYICGQPEYARLLLANTNGQEEEALEEFDHEFLGISNPERAVMARKLLASCYMIDFL